MTTKRYRLLKDLPDLKATAIFENYIGDIYTCRDSKDGSPYSGYVVKNNPDWFEPINEKSVSEQKPKFKSCEEIYKFFKELPDYFSEREKVNITREKMGFPPIPVDEANTQKAETPLPEKIEYDGKWISSTPLETKMMKAVNAIIDYLKAKES